MKFIIFLHVTSGAPRADFQSWLQTTGVPSLAETATRCVLNLVAPDQAGRFDAVVELWAPSDSALSALRTPLWTQRTDSIAYDVTEQMEKNTLQLPAGQPTQAVKLMAGWTRRDDVSATDARRHWDEHVPLANRIHVGCERYVRHWVQRIAHAHAGDPPAYQGIAFQYYRTQRDLQERSFDHPESVAVIQDDVADFLLDSDVYIVQEFLIKGDPAHP